MRELMVAKHFSHVELGAWLDDLWGSSSARLWIAAGALKELVPDSPPGTWEAWGQLVSWMCIMIIKQNYISRLTSSHSEAVSQACLGTPIVLVWDTSWKVSVVASDIFLKRNQIVGDKNSENQLKRTVRPRGHKVKMVLLKTPEFPSGAHLPGVHHVQQHLGCMGFVLAHRPWVLFSAWFWLKDLITVHGCLLPSP